MSSSVISFIHHLRFAKAYAEDAKRQQSSVTGNNFWSKYIGKIDWIKTDFITYPEFTDVVRKGVQDEWNSDVFTVTAINEKVPLLNPIQREQLEAVLDMILAGQTGVINLIKEDDK